MPQNFFPGYVNHDASGLTDRQIQVQFELPEGTAKKLDFETRSRRTPPCSGPIFTTCRQWAA